MAKHIYADIISLMNHKQYKVQNVPLSYVASNLVEVKDSLGQVVEPGYNPDENETTSWRVSIVVMVDMFFNKVPFRFSSANDLEEVYRQLESYIHWINQFKTIPPDHKVFVTRAKPFLTYITERCNRIRFQKKQQGLIPLTFGDHLFSGSL